MGREVISRFQVAYKTTRNMMEFLQKKKIINEGMSW